MADNDFITKNKRNRNVTEYDYGDIESCGYGYYDLPVKAEIVYDDNMNIIFENYDKLIFYIENNLIPNNIVKKDDDFYYIRLKDIVTLKFSDREVKFIIDYLDSKNIFVLGYSSSLEGEFDNYICIRTRGEKNVSIDLPVYSLSAKDEVELFLEYKKNPSLELKQKIALINSRLVSLQCGIYSKLFGISVDELFGYGMMGLLRAIPLFDVSLGTRFSTFANYRIKRDIMRGIEVLKGVPLKDNNEAYSFCMTLGNVENNNGNLLSEDISIVDDLITCLIDKNVISNDIESNKAIKRWGNIINHLSLEEIIMSDNDDKILYNVVGEDNNKNYYSVDKSLEIAYLRMLRDDVSKVLDMLDEKTSDILRRRYGIFPYDDSYSLEKIGKIYGMSHESIRKLEKKGIDKLRVYSKRRILEDYYE